MHEILKKKVLILSPYQWRSQGGGVKGAIAPPWAMFICLMYLDYLIESMDARFIKGLLMLCHLKDLFRPI
jgi:hypothetical protein